MEFLHLFYDKNNIDEFKKKSSCCMKEYDVWAHWTNTILVFPTDFNSADIPTIAIIPEQEWIGLQIVGFKSGLFFPMQPLEDKYLWHKSKGHKGCEKIRYTMYNTYMNCNSTFFCRIYVYYMQST